MSINKLAHYSIRTPDLSASCRFYTEILGFIEGFRPPFDFPGKWLYRGGDEADFGVVHLIGTGCSDDVGLSQYLGDKNSGNTAGTGVLDHVAFLASGWPDIRARLNNAGLSFVERTVPGLGLHQVFVEDPSGLTVELNFPANEGATA